MKIRSHILLWIFVSNVGMIKPFPFYSSDLEILQWLSGSEHMELLTKNAIKPNLAQCDLEKYSYWKWHKTAPPCGVFPSCIIIYRNIDRFFVMLRTLENSLIASLTKLEKKLNFKIVIITKMWSVLIRKWRLDLVTVPSLILMFSSWLVSSSNKNPDPSLARAALISLKILSPMFLLTSTLASI